MTFQKRHITHITDNTMVRRCELVCAVWCPVSVAGSMVTPVSSSLFVCHIPVIMLSGPLIGHYGPILASDWLKNLGIPRSARPKHFNKSMHSLPSGLMFGFHLDISYSLRAFTNGKSKHDFGIRKDHSGLHDCLRPEPFVQLVSF